MAYDNPLTVTHELGSVNFASATATAIKGPPGHKGRIRDMGVRVTTLFTTVTLAGTFKLGTTGDDDAYALLRMGVDAGGTAPAATDVWNVQNDSDAIIEPDLPADTQIEVTYGAPTGGTPAGVGNPYVVIDWFK